MYFYPGSEELICLSCLLPCCMTGFIFPVITDYTRYQGALRQLHPDCVLPGCIWKLRSWPATDWEAINTGYSWSVGCCGDDLKLLTLPRQTSPVHLKEEKWWVIRALDSRCVLKMAPPWINTYPHYTKIFDCHYLLLLLFGFLSGISGSSLLSSLPYAALKHWWCFTR